jgi:hypothetical protein
VLDESRVTTCGGYSILNASINGVNLPNGTAMWFYFDTRLVGEVALVNGSAKMAPYNLGDYLSRKDSVSVYRTPVTDLVGGGCRCAWEPRLLACSRRARSASRGW